MFVSRVFFWKQLCYVLAETNRTAFVIFVESWQRKHKQSRYHHLWGKLTSFNSSVRLAIRTKFGLQNLAAPHVKNIDRLVKSHAQVDAFCCADGGWTWKSFGQLLFFLTSMTSPWNLNTIYLLNCDTSLMMTQCQCRSHQNSVLWTQYENREMLHQKLRQTQGKTKIFQPKLP